jgi:hypothetical protein
VPLCAGSDSPAPTQSRLAAFDGFDVAIWAVLTGTLVAAVTLGGQVFSWRAAGFLAVMNAASLAMGRAASPVAAPFFRVFGDYIFGVCAISLIVLAVCVAGAVSAWVGAGVAAVISAGAAVFAMRRGARAARGSADFILLLVICAACFIWSWQAVMAMPGLRATGLFSAWADYFLHAGEVAQFAQFGALHGTSIFAAGAALPFYHYGTYMVPAALCAVSHVPALVATTVLWTLLGFLIFGLSAALLGGALGGEAAGIAAVIAVLLLPDAAHYGLKNPFFDFHWLMQVAASGSYAMALACLALAMFLRWLRAGQRRDLAWAIGLVLGTFELRVHIFLVLSLTIAIMFLAVWRPARWWLRPVLVVLGAGAALLAMALLAAVPRAPDFFSGVHDPIGTLEGMLKMPPSWCADFYEHVVNSEHFTNPVARALWIGAVGALGFLQLSLAAFGALFPVYLGALGWLAWRGACRAEDFLPLAAVTAYFAMVAIFPDTPKEPFEFAHRPFVLPYTLLAIWCARYAMLAVQAGLRPAAGRRTALGVSVLLLAVPLALQSTAQSSGIQWNFLFSQIRIPAATQQAAEFLRRHAAEGEVVATPENPLDDAFLALSERPTLSPGTNFMIIQSGISPADALRRQQDIAAIFAPGAAPDAAEKFGARWVMSFPGTARPCCDSHN